MLFVVSLQVKKFHSSGTKDIWVGLGSVHNIGISLKKRLRNRLSERSKGIYPNSSREVRNMKCYSCGKESDVKWPVWDSKNHLLYCYFLKVVREKEERERRIYNACN